MKVVEGAGALVMGHACILSDAPDRNASVDPAVGRAGDLYGQPPLGSTAI
jgi:hypothetical protein